MYRLVYRYADGAVDLEGVYAFRSTARHIARQSLAAFQRAFNAGSIGPDNMPEIRILNIYGDTVETVSAL